MNREVAAADAQSVITHLFCTVIKHHARLHMGSTLNGLQAAVGGLMHRSTCRLSITHHQWRTTIHTIHHHHTHTLHGRTKKRKAQRHRTFCLR
jgi:hypothetical protein